MNAYFEDISVRDLFSNDFSSEIQNAEARAREIVQQGAFVQIQHAEGRNNSSCMSSTVGTTAAANEIVAQLPMPEDSGREPFFGQNLKETFAFFKGLAKKR